MELRSSNEEAERRRIPPIRGLGRWKDTTHKGVRRHGCLPKGVSLLLKATLPTCAPKRHGLSLLQHAPRPPLRLGGWVPHVMQTGPAVTSDPPLLPRPTGGRGGQPCRRHATAPGGRASPTSDTPVWRSRPTRRATSAPVAACKQPCHHLCHCRASSVAEPMPRLEATSARPSGASLARRSMRPKVGRQ
jgi:hypothetical protein